VGRVGVAWKQSASLHLWRNPENVTIKIETCCSNTIINIIKFCWVWKYYKKTYCSGFGTRICFRVKESVNGCTVTLALNVEGVIFGTVWMRARVSHIEFHVLWNMLVLMITECNAVIWIKWFVYHGNYLVWKTNCTFSNLQWNEHVSENFHKYFHIIRNILAFFLSLRNVSVTYVPSTCYLQLSDCDIALAANSRNLRDLIFDLTSCTYSSKQRNSWLCSVVQWRGDIFLWDWAPLGG